MICFTSSTRRLVPDMTSTFSSLILHTCSLLFCNLRKQPKFRDVWGTSAKIPCWCRITTHILPRYGKCFWWVKIFSSANQMRHPDLGRDASSIWNFCCRSSDANFFFFGGGGGEGKGDQWWRWSPKCWLLCSDYFTISLTYYFILQ